MTNLPEYVIINIQFYITIPKQQEETHDLHRKD